MRRRREWRKGLREDRGGGGAFDRGRRRGRRRRRRRSKGIWTK